MFPQMNFGHGAYPFHFNHDHNGRTPYGDVYTMNEAPPFVPYPHVMNRNGPITPYSASFFPGMEKGEGGKPFQKTEDTISASAQHINRHPHLSSRNSGKLLYLSTISSNFSKGRRNANGRFPAEVDHNSRSGNSHFSENAYVASVIHNGKREVGVCFIVFPSLAVQLMQYGDSSSFTKTIHALCTYKPLEVLVVGSQHSENAQTGDLLTQTLLRNFEEEISFTAIQRKYYNSEAGIEKMRFLKSNQSNRSSSLNDDYYLSYAAFNALIEYLEDVNSINFANHSLLIKNLNMENFCFLSRQSAKCLHVIAETSQQRTANNNGKISSSRHNNARGGESQLGRVNYSKKTSRNGRESEREHVGSTVDGIMRRRNRQADSGQHMGQFLSDINDGGRSGTLQLQALIHTLQSYTITHAGRRLLRSTVLQPIKDKCTLRLRLDVVDYFLKTHNNGRFESASPWLNRKGGDTIFTKVRYYLQQMSFVDFDRLISQFSQVSVEGDGTDLFDGIPLAKKQLMLRNVMELFRLFRVIAELQSYLESVLPSSEEVMNGEGGAADVDWNDNDELNFFAEATRQESSPEKPLLLLTLLGTIKRCDIDRLTRQMSDYLDVNLLNAAGTNNGNGIFQKLQAFFIVRSVLDDQGVGAKNEDALDVSRNYFTLKIEEITNYLFFLKNNFYCSPITSLKLELDSDKFYCFSYKYEEDTKTNHINPEVLSSRGSNEVKADLFKYKYAGGSHNMLYMQSLMNNAQENRERDEDGERSSGYQNSEQPFFLQPAPQRYPETANPEGASAKRGKNRWQTKKKVFCTTERLETLCGHAKHFAENIIAEELKKILPLFQQIKANISYLQALGEALSLLDMLASFTEYSLLFNAVRPQFDNQMPGHVLRDFVHPSMVVKQAGNANFCVPNTIFWQGERGDNDGTKEKLILTLSGSNNSGKTTLLRMVSQIQILCQIGCFIPLLNRGDEDSNHVVLFDKICGHLMCDSLPQIETSSFRRELLELADMMKELDEMEDSNALLLFDELGRSTNTRESFTLCCAVMRYIIEKQKQNHAARGDEEEEGAMKRRSNVFLGVFSTHFKSLIQLSGVFAEIDNFYFELMCNEKHDENHGKNGTTKITVSHQLCHGAGEVNKSNVNYGLHLAKHLGLPSLIVDNAFKLLSKTEKKGS